VATIIYAANALANLERAFEVLAAGDVRTARRAAAAIAEAVDLLARHPLVGRIVEGELRELVISFGKTGYVALYRFVPARDEVRVLAIRHQRELGYAGP
jgi:plasmid stabilization system protein ParE